VLSILMVAGAGGAFVVLLVMAVVGFMSTSSVPARAAGGSAGGGGAPWAGGASGDAGRQRAGAARRRTRQARKRSNTSEPPLLGPDATLTFGGEQQSSDLDEILDGLDRDLVGLAPVKRKIQEIGSLLMVDHARRRFGLHAPKPNMHMCFTGPPGTGKTTVALRMAELLHRLGFLESGHLVHAMRDDLVGEYIGQTAPKTKKVLERARGGVLFIDEAYYLYRAADSKDFGQEAIDILLQVMENERDQLVVILAGYADRMDNFFDSNPGMNSRIAHHLEFAPYDLDELVAIGKLMLDQSRYYLSPGAETTLRQYLASSMHAPRFANGRSVRNQLEGARLRHADRLASERNRAWGRDDLMRLEAVDIPVWTSSPLADDQPSVQGV
jgi:probable Rubsico expression protein CbbX